MKRTTHSTAIKTALVLSIIALTTATASAAPKLTGISYEPTFISAGDRVNISANIMEPNYPDKVWDEDNELKAVLKPGNKLTREYVTIEENRDESIGFLYPEGAWNQKYRVKIDSDAPTGNYDFEIHLQYLENGAPVKIETENGESNVTIVRDFTMPVDNEGVDLTADVQRTSPKVPRPGDNYVELGLSLTNTGNKPLQEIEIIPETPEYIETSYSSDEKFFIGKIMEGKVNTQTLTVDLDEELSPGTHWIDLSATYEDEESNTYSEELKVPIRVEGRPDLELVKSKTEMKAGATSNLHLKVRNDGDQDAESVTARVIAERAQPFSLEDRSNYIGEIEAGETGEAVLKLSADSSAAMKTHQVKVELRANGDSEEGDNSVYSFTENAEVEITGKTQSPLIFVGIAAAALVALAAGYRYLGRRSGGEKDGE